MSKSKPALRIEREGNLKRLIINQDDELVADMYADSIHDYGIPDNVEINRYATLFAASPAMADLLHDLELLVRVNAPMTDGSQVHKAIQKVLKQAGIEI